MGSLVLAQPMFLKLRERFPEATLHALVFRKNREVLDLVGEVPAENVFTLRDDSLSNLLIDALRAVRALRRIRIDTVLDCELFARVSAILSFLTGARRRVGFERHTQEGLYRGRFINRPVLYNPYQHIAAQFLTLVEAIDGAGMPLVKRVVGEGPMRIRPLRLQGDELETLRRRVEDDFPSARGARMILLYPGGGLLPIRAWPLASFQELAEAFTSRGFAVGVIGLAEDRPLAAQICGSANGMALDFTGYTRTVRELMLLFHLSELLVTNDGGPGHFAAMTPIRTLVLYGPETPLLYGTLGPDSFSFFSNLSCSPCLTAYNHRKSPCDGDNQCLKRISPGEVLARALAMLGSK
jgi:ADP-heptose:LPS heptosyltransferase